MDAATVAQQCTSEHVAPEGFEQSNSHGCAPHYEIFSSWSKASRLSLLCNASALPFKVSVTNSQAKFFGQVSGQRVWHLAVVSKGKGLEDAGLSVPGISGSLWQSFELLQLLQKELLLVLVSRCQAFTCRGVSL